MLIWRTVASALCAILAACGQTAEVPTNDQPDPKATADSPLPGNPDITIRTKLNEQWRIIGMNYDWMFLVTPSNVVSLTGVTGRVRIEHVKGQAGPDGKSFLSEDLLHEVRCGEGKWRLVGIKSFAGNNLTGGVVEEVENWRIAEWQTLESGSIFEAAMEEICRLHGKG